MWGKQAKSLLPTLLVGNRILHHSQHLLGAGDTQADYSAEYKQAQSEFYNTAELKIYLFPFAHFLLLLSEQV